MAAEVKRSQARRLFVACACLFLSGFAALVYQLVWMHHLAIAIGTAQSAVAITLACYMAGLALGGLVGARLQKSEISHARIYAVLELTIALWALAIPTLMVGARAFMITALGHSAFLPADTGIAQSAFYGLIGFALLGIPTLCMGATLPLIIRVVEPAKGSSEGGLAIVYAVNTLGAALGALLTGFLLIPSLGMTGTTFVAVALNFAAAALGWTILDRAKRSESLAKLPVPETSAPSPGLPILALAAGLTGIATFALEIFWSRLLAHTLGGTARGVALMLGIWLLGLAIGAGISSRIAALPMRASRMLMYIIYAGAALTLIGYLALVELAITSIAGVTAVLLPGTICLGATFPLFVRASGATGAALSRTAGYIYAANTAGAILGSLLCGYFILERFGFEGTAAIAAALLVAGGLAVGSAARFRVADLVVPALVLSVGIAGLPQARTILDTSVVDRAATGTRIYFAVGRTATVQVFDRPDGIALRSDGLPEALAARRGAPPVFNDQMWLGVLPALVRPQARSMMMVGLGGGVALETVPSWIRSIDVVEIEGRVIDANHAIASIRDLNPLADPRVTLIRNDARNALSRTDRRYDILVSQPSHPWTAGSANLYTSEFIALAKTRLRPDGVMVQWMNAAFVNPDLLRAFTQTIAGQFRHIRVYEPVPLTLMFVASDGEIDPEGQFDATMARAAPIDVMRLARAGILARADLLWPLLMDDNTVATVVRNAEPISDDRNSLAAQSRPANAGSTREAIDALIGADAPLARLPIDPGTAAYMTLRLNGTGRTALAARFAAGRRPVDIGFDGWTPDRPLSGANSVADAWALGARGDWNGLAGLDRDLAAARMTDPWFPISVKLRADWRIGMIGELAADSADRRNLAREALAIVDSGLRVSTTSDLLMQRATLAQVLSDATMLTETALAFAEQSENTPISELIIRRAQSLQAALQQLPQSRTTDLAIDRLGAIIG